MWTGLSLDESIRMTEINGESKSMVWPTLGSRTSKEQNRTTDVSHLYSQFCRVVAEKPFLGLQR